MKEIVVKILKEALKETDIDINDSDIKNRIEVPPSFEMGDYAFPCFFLSEKLKENPHQIAIKIRENIGTRPIMHFDDIQVSGPYINFFLNRKNLAKKIIAEILRKKENFGSLNLENGKKIMVEFPSPNTNKPLHLGHLRNMSIGESVSRILEFSKNKITRANLNNDRGIHISKSMLAYKRYGKNKKPTKKIKSDHFVGDFYVLFNEKAKKNKKLEKDAQDILLKWENGDKETIELWKRMNKWALDGFKETYNKFGIKIDKNYNESDIHSQGKEIIFDGLKRKIFKKKKDGTIIIDLKNENLGEKVLLRADGTSIYITQDIYLAKLKFDEFKLDSSIYVTGNEQDYHFNVLFTIIKKLGFSFADKIKHLSYGMVFLPHGKMKSREGTVVDADELIDETKELVKKELKSRYRLSKKELESRSLKIALAAIKYFLLKIDSKKNMLFNPKEAINFEGDTGSYILYSYARASSILRKIKNREKTKNAFKIYNLEAKEIELVKKISQFPEVVISSYNSINPSFIANYSYQLSQKFNEFYHTCPVVSSKEENFRLVLVEAFRQVLKNSLNLLGIEPIEKM